MRATPSGRRTSTAKKPKAQKLALGALALIALAAPDLRGHDDNNDDNRGNRTIELVDDCDPDDPAWLPIGCLQKDGDVTAAEFNAFLRSPLYDNIPPPGVEPGLFLVGHPSWRNDPSHVVIQAGKELRVRNVGGRPHTFTAVAQLSLRQRCHRRRRAGHRGRADSNNTSGSTTRAAVARDVINVTNRAKRQRARGRSRAANFLGVTSIVGGQRDDGIQSTDAF